MTRQLAIAAAAVTVLALTGCSQPSAGYTEVQAAWSTMAPETQDGYCYQFAEHPDETVDFIVLMAESDPGAAEVVTTDDVADFLDDECADTTGWLD